MNTKLLQKFIYLIIYTLTTHKAMSLRNHPLHLQEFAITCVISVQELNLKVFPPGSFKDTWGATPFCTTTVHSEKARII